MCKSVQIRLTGDPDLCLVYDMTETSLTMTLTDVSKHVGIKRRTLYNMLNDGRFPVKCIPGTNPRRWNVNDVNAWSNGK